MLADLSEADAAVAYSWFSAIPSQNISHMGDRQTL
jgi:hypothetical protein